jgi:hypothetical protein
MRQKNVFTTILITVILLASCSKGLDVNDDNLQNDASDVILQKRNPNLPRAKALVLNDFQTRSDISGAIGNSDVFLGYGYNLKNGNYILGAQSNVTHAIIDLNAIKAYDSTFVTGIRLNTTETSSFAYNTFDRYQYNSIISKKVTSGVSLNFKMFSLGKKKATTDIFKTVIDNMDEATYGELNLNFINSQFALENSEATRRLFSRQFLTKSFIRNLYNSTIKSTLDAYGDFVLTGYMTGGKAYAFYAGNATKAATTNEKEKDMEESINASITYKSGNNSGSGSGDLGFSGSNKVSTETAFSDSTTYIYIKTYGGKRDGGEAEIKARAIKGLNIDLSSWMNSLSDVSNHEMVDLVDNSLYPLSSFVLEKNFKQRLDDTSDEILPYFNDFVDPYIEIVRVLVRSTPSYEPLYDVVPILVTRQGDRIILKDGSTSSATDEELRKNNDDNVFIQKAKDFAANTSKLFSSELQISYNTRKRINPVLRNPLCIELTGFNKQNFYRFYYEKTSIEYIYDPSSRICFSYYIDEGDDEALDVYGIRSWVESLPERNISIASLANSYKIIGL